MIPVARRFLQQVIRHRYMIFQMVQRSFKSRYAHSFLGMGWTVIQPIFQIAIYVFVFSYVIRVPLGKGYTGVPFALWLVSGLLPWLFVAEVLHRAPQILLEQSAFITKNPFPSELLPLISTTSGLFTHVLQLFLLAMAMIFSGHLCWRSLPWLLPCLACLGLLVLGLGWLISAIHVFLRDVGQALNVALLIWHFLTPIFYPPQIIPQKVLWALRLNPLFHLVAGYRQALLGREPLSLAGLGQSALFSFACFLLGGWVFRRLKPYFADVL